MSVGTGFFSSVKVTSPLGVTYCNSGTCTYQVAAGSSMTVQVTSTFDYIDCFAFRGWTGSCTSTAAACTFTVDGAESVHPRWTRATRDPRGNICVPR